MTKRKSVLQRISFVSGVVSFVLALVSGVMLYIRMQSVIGVDNPISASFLASTFFFVCIGIVFTVIGTADLPSFKFDNPEGK